MTPARQEFTQADDANSWGGQETSPQDWGFSEADEGDLWGGRATNASDWGLSDPSPRSAAQAQDRAEEHRTPDPSRKGKEVEVAWESNGGDAAEWGVQGDAHDRASEATKNNNAAWGPTDDPSAWEVEASTDDATAWEAARSNDVSAWAAMVDSSPTQASKSDQDVSSSFDPAADLKVVRSGALIPQSNVLELATRSSNYLDRTSNDDTFYQLFLTQSPTHLVAVHQRGNFERVIRQELASEEFLRVAEADHIRRVIAQFVALLQEIQRLVKEHGKKRSVSLVCVKGNLELFELGGQEGLVHKEELARFDRARLPVENA